MKSVAESADSTDGSAPRRFAGEAWAMGAVFGYTGANLFGRAGVMQGNPLAAPLLRDLPSLILGLLLLARGGHHRQILPGSGSFAGGILLLFVGSGIASVIGTFAFFFALDTGGVNIAVPVLQTQIIWGALFGRLLLGERVTARGALGILVTFAGLLLLTFGQSRGIPVSDSWLLGLLLALVPALAWGLSGVIWRFGQHRGIDRAGGITVHYGTSVIVTLLFLSFSGQLQVYETLRSQDLTALLLSGVFGGMIAVYSMFSAMKLLPAATVFVLNGLTPMATALGGWLFLAEYINTPMWLGILLASVGVVVFQLTGVEKRQAQGPPTGASAASRGRSGSGGSTGSDSRYSSMGDSRSAGAGTAEDSIASHDRSTSDNRKASHACSGPDGQPESRG